MPFGRVYVPPPSTSTLRPLPDLRLQLPHHAATGHQVNGFRTIPIQVVKAPKEDKDPDRYSEAATSSNGPRISKVSHDEVIIYPDKADEDLLHKEATASNGRRISKASHDEVIIEQDKVDDDDDDNLLNNKATTLNGLQVEKASKDVTIAEQNQVGRDPDHIEATALNGLQMAKASMEKVAMFEAIPDADDGYDPIANEDTTSNGLEVSDEDAGASKVLSGLSNGVADDVPGNDEAKVVSIKEAIVDGATLKGEAVSSHVGLNFEAKSTKGLKNLGNTCYMNSIIQCLAHTQPFVLFCMDEARKAGLVGGTLGKSSVDGTAASNAPKMVRSFGNLLTDMWNLKTPPSYASSLNHGVSDPSSFRREVTGFAPKFAGYDQHDSQEFLQYALEGFHAELNRRKQANGPSIRHCGRTAEVNLENPSNGEVKEEPRKSYEEILEDPVLSAEEKGRECLDLYLAKDSSLVTDLFLGQFRSTLKCCECHHESVTFEPFWVISVPIPKEGESASSVTLNDCLNEFVKVETLDEDERPTCEKCKDRRKSWKWYSVERWPDILVIHLKRFAPSGSYRSKLTGKIGVPLRNMDLRYNSNG